ncbi:MAG: VPLPA-CTERM sorting domain-containing protein [Roseinatronobacter sp.]
MFRGNGPSGAELSYWSVYATGTPAVIPLPWSGLLLISALGGLAAMRRNRKSSV